MAKGTFNDQKYISLALGKGPGLKGLQYQWRHADKLIGCDGHRLHMITGLPFVHEGQYVSAPNGTPEYPNYEMVLPKEERFIGTMKIDRPEMKRLKGFLDLASTRGVKITRDRSCEGALIVRYKDNTVECRMEIPLQSDSREFLDIGIDLQFFFDAVVEGREMDVYCDGINRALILKCQYPSVMSYALIMGTRI